MYNANPLHIAGAVRSGGRRARRPYRIGASEFSMCPDGTWVKGRATADKCGTPPTGGNTPPNIRDILHGGGYGGWNTPFNTPSGGGSGGSGGAPYTPPTGTGGGGMPDPGTPYTPPYTPPSSTSVPYTPPSSVPAGCAPPAIVCPENQRRYIMPFNPDTGYVNTVAAGATVRFVGNPQALFQPDRLIIASTIAPYFDIIDLSIGNVPQSLSTGAVAADIYSEVATDMNFNFKQAYPGLAITITARNKSSITQTFQAQLAGFAVAQG